MGEFHVGYGAMVAITALERQACLATQQVPRQHELHGTLSQKQSTCLVRNKTDFPSGLSRRQQIIKETHGLGAKFISDVH